MTIPSVFSCVKKVVRFLKSDFIFMLGVELTNYYSNMQRKRVLVRQCLSARSSFFLVGCRYMEKLLPISEE